MDYNIIKEKLLGAFIPEVWITMHVFGVIGAILALYVMAIGARDKQSLNTPAKFSNRFLLKDNIERLLVGQILFYLSLRFGSTFWIGVIKDEMFTAFGLGFALGFGFDIVLFVMIDKIPLVKKYLKPKITLTTLSTNPDDDEENNEDDTGGVNPDKPRGGN